MGKAMTIHPYAKRLQRAWDESRNPKSGKKYTIEEFASLIGIPERTMRRWFKGSGVSRMGRKIIDAFLGGKKQ